jgi:hypothetical protein
VAGLRSAALLYRVLRASGTSSSHNWRSEVLVKEQWRDLGARVYAIF